MTTFEAVVDYAGTRVKVSAETFAELHEAIAGIEELNRDADFLKDQGVSELVPVYRKDSSDNEYYGFQDQYSRRNVSFGKKREGGIIPFFPKGADGYYDPSAHQRNPGPQSQQAAPPEERTPNGSRRPRRRDDRRRPRRETNHLGRPQGQIPY